MTLELNAQKAATLELRLETFGWHNGRDLLDCNSARVLGIAGEPCRERAPPGPWPLPCADARSPLLGARIVSCSCCSAAGSSSDGEHGARSDVQQLPVRTVLR